MSKLAKLSQVESTSVHHHSPTDPTPVHPGGNLTLQKGKAQTTLQDACHAQGCKAKSKQFDFCSEHYEHFKFGLIKKTGQRVPDYEKKMGHYLKFQNQKKLQKVA